MATRKPKPKPKPKPEPKTAAKRATKSGGKRATSAASLPNRGRTRRRLSPAGDSADRRGSGRTVKGRETRERLLAAAQTVFERDGFLRARVTDICDEAGVSHGSFYTYFFSKEEVLAELLDAVELDLLDMRSERDDRTPIERIRDANRHYLEVYRRNAGLISVINQVASFDEEVLESRTERHVAFAHAIEKRIRQYQREGIADDALDPWFAANALGGMVTSMAEYLFIDHDEDDIDHGVEQLTTLWVNAIGLGHAED